MNIPAFMIPVEPFLISVVDEVGKLLLQREGQIQLIVDTGKILIIGHGCFINYYQLSRILQIINNYHGYCRLLLIIMVLQIIINCQGYCR